MNLESLTKLYYSIGEVSKLFGVSSSLIRYWETEFSVLKPQKNRKGDRRYTKKDIEVIHKIYNLVKERGFTLDGAKKELKNKRSKPKSTEVIQKLQSIKNGLEKLKKKLD